MVKIINVVLKRQTPSGLICSSTRQIAVWGRAAEGDAADKLAASLIDEDQLRSQDPGQKANSDIVRETCDRLFPGSWDFAGQGGTVEF